MTKTLLDLQFSMAAFTNPGGNKVPSEHGSLARVGENDIEKLREIVHDLLALKYEEDASGSLPINVHFVDRTRYEGVSVNYTKHLPGDGDLDAYEAALIFNLRSANSAVQSAAHKLDIATRMLSDFYEQTELKK
jgi:hypothetical protein